MAIDSTAFLVRFPEFTKTPVSLIDAKITEAASQLSATVWGSKLDLGLGYLVAMLLAQSPGGQFARLQPANVKIGRDAALTVYEREFKRLASQVSSGFRVTGKDTSK